MPGRPACRCIRSAVTMCTAGRQHHVRHIPCLILKDDRGNELTRTECAHTLETLHLAFDAALKGGENK